MNKFWGASFMLIVSQLILGLFVEKSGDLSNPVRSKHTSRTGDKKCPT